MSDTVDPKIVVFREYLEALDAGDLDSVAAKFGEEAIFIRPDAPSPGETQFGRLVVLKGRPAVRDFAEKRQQRPWRHRLDAARVDGSDCFFELFLEDDDGPFAFCMSCVSFDEHGLISRVVSLPPSAVDAAITEQIRASRPIPYSIAAQ